MCQHSHLAKSSWTLNIRSLKPKHKCIYAFNPKLQALTKLISLGPYVGAHGILIAVKRMSCLCKEKQGSVSALFTSHPRTRVKTQYSHYQAMVMLKLRHKISSDEPNVVALQASGTESSWSHSNLFSISVQLQINYKHSQRNKSFMTSTFTFLNMYKPCLIKKQCQWPEKKPKKQKKQCLLYSCKLLWSDWCWLVFLFLPTDFSSFRWIRLVRIDITF